MQKLKPAGLFCAWFALAFLVWGPTLGSRNGSGTYAIPNTFTAGTTITAAAHNQNFSDIATELTNSVAADGQTSMTGPLKASNGTVGAPSHTFASDTDSGLYRIGANNIGLALGGSKVVDYASTGVTVTGTVDATTIKQGTFTLVPAGTVLMYAGSSLPAGYLTGDGSAVSRSTYASLFTNISTTFGTGDGSTTFNLPDCTGRVLAGKESSATRLTSAGSGIDGATLGSTGGAQTVTLARANLPNTDFMADGAGSLPTATSSSVSGNPTSSAAQTSVAQYGASGGGTGTLVTPTITLAGHIYLNGNVTQTTVNKMPPAVVLNCIIKY